MVAVERIGESIDVNVFSYLASDALRVHCEAQQTWKLHKPIAAFFAPVRGALHW